MPAIQVMLEVAPPIAAGLASGQLERVGGVIRETGSKQVVAWLREGGKLANNSNAASSMLSALLNTSTGGVAAVAASVVETAFTARSHYLIMKQLGRLETLLSFSAGIGILNLATSIYSYTALSSRLDNLEQQIERLNKHISDEFQKNREAQLTAAILAAKNAFGMKKPENKKRQAHNAIVRFHEVREYILQDLERLFEKSQSLEQTVSALVYAIDMDTLLIRCHLELDELCSARNHLHEYLGKYEPQVHELVDRCLGYHRASFFHKSVSKTDLYRFIAIVDWLHRNDEIWTHNKEDDVVMKVLESNRKHFWDKNELKRVKSNSPSQIDRIALAELLIEKYEGFRGFGAELEGIARLSTSYSDWEQQQEKALAGAKTNLAEHDDYVLLVDKDWLNEQPKLKQSVA